jgi:uncharacterized protein (DUF58 family)
VRRAAGIGVAGTALILVAFTLGTSELLVPGVAFVLLAALIPPWVLAAARGASVTRTIDTDQVLEDQPLEANISVQGGVLGIPGAEVTDPLAGRTINVTSQQLTLRLRGAGEIRIVARFARRGRRRIQPPAVVMSDPLGLMRATVPSRAGAQTLLVLPRTERVRWRHGDAGAQLDRHAGMAVEMLAATDIDGLRPYRPGTPASRISWSALARGAGLLERRLRAERDTGPLVVLDVRCDGDVEPIDAAVRAAASLAVELAHRTGCELLLPEDRRPLQLAPDLGAWPDAHARLALVEGGPDAPVPALASRSRSGTIFYVAAASDRLPARLAGGAFGAVVLVLPAALSPASRHAPVFEVSGCRGYLLGAAARKLEPESRAA